MSSVNKKKKKKKKSPELRTQNSKERNAEGVANNIWWAIGSCYFATGVRNNTLPIAAAVDQSTLKKSKKKKKRLLLYRGKERKASRETEWRLERRLENDERVGGGGPREVWTVKKKKQNEGHKQIK